MKRLLAAMTAALMMVALVASAAVAAPKSTSTYNLLNHVAYYTVNAGTTFCRWATPQSLVDLTGGGTASQFRNSKSKAVSLFISGANGYADNGFYVPLGTLGDLAEYTVLASGDTFSTNLWFDTNTGNDSHTNGDFFLWSGGCLSGLDGDISVLGQPSTATGTDQSVTVNDDSTFLCPSDGLSVTLAQLKAGDCAGIDGTTQVAVWIGFSVNSGSHGTIITSAQATFAP